MRDAEGIQKVIESIIYSWFFTSRLAVADVDEWAGGSKGVIV